MSRRTLQKLWLLPSLSGGNSHFRHFPVPWILWALWPEALGHRAVPCPRQEGRCSFFLQRVCCPVSLRCLHPGSDQGDSQETRSLDQESSQDFNGAMGW